MYITYDHKSSTINNSTTTTNIQIHIGDDKYIHICVNLAPGAKEHKLLKVAENKALADELEYF